MSRSDGELVYVCAAWLAGPDSVTDTADALQAKVDTLRAQRRRYLPRSEQLPWWEEFGELLRRLPDETVTVGKT